MNLSVVEIGGGSDASWDRLVAAQNDASAYHYIGWYHLIKKVFGHDSYLILAKSEGGELSGGMPVTFVRSRVFGNSLVSTPYVSFGGPIGSDECYGAILDEAKSLAQSLSARNFDCRSSPAAWEGLQTRSDKVRMVLNLPDSREDLTAGLRGKTRSQVRRARRESFDVRVGQADLVPDFFDIFSRNMKRLGTPTYPKQFFSEMMRNFGDRAKLLLVYIDGKAAAGGLLMRHGPMLEIPWASSLPEYNRLGVNMLLYDEALGVAIEEGCSKFDFGRSTPGSGTYAFKKQWGASPVTMNWTYWSPEGGEISVQGPSNPKFRLAISLWRKLPLGVTRWLGPKIVGGIP